MAPRARAFRQVDVFATAPFTGNPVAVVLDAGDLTDAQMRRFAAWTNLSETAFVLPPTVEGADYRLRILTPRTELPFAGHPTLGSAYAWLGSGGRPASAGHVVQECAGGLVPVRHDGDRLAFRAPPLLRSGPLDEEHLAEAARGLGIDRDDIVDHQWVDNGPGWAAVLLGSARQVLDLEPDPALMRSAKLGVVGLHPAGAEEQLEVRAFAPGAGLAEDPVTGSLNAGVGQWLTGNGTLPASYVAGQGRRLGRRGRISIETVEDEVWTGGRCVTAVRGEAEL